MENKLYICSHMHMCEHESCSGHKPNKRDIYKIDNMYCYIVMKTISPICINEVSDINIMFEELINEVSDIDIMFEELINEIV